MTKRSDYESRSVPRRRVRIIRTDHDVTPTLTIDPSRPDGTWGRPDDDPLVFKAMHSSRTVYIHLTALIVMTEHARSSPHAEVGGFLIGRADADADGAFTIIEQALPASRAAGTRTELEFPPEAWVELHEFLDGEAAGTCCVGWYHTHPSLGIFLSGHDQFLHRNWFPHDEHVAIVADPRLEQAGVFVGTRGNIGSPGKPETLFRLLGRRDVEIALRSITPDRQPALIATATDLSDAAEVDSPQADRRINTPPSLGHTPAENVAHPPTLTAARRRRRRLVSAVCVLLAMGASAVATRSFSASNDSPRLQAKSTVPARKPIAAPTLPAASAPTTVPTAPPACDPIAVEARFETTGSNIPPPMLVLTSRATCVFDRQLGFSAVRPDLQYLGTARVQGIVSPEGLRQRLPFVWRWCRGPTQLRVTDANQVLIDFIFPDVDPDPCTPI